MLVNKVYIPPERGPIHVGASHATISVASPNRGSGIMVHLVYARVGFTLGISISCSLCHFYGFWWNMGL